MNVKSKWFWALILFFLISHIVNLTILPVFADEAIYIRWGQFFGREPLKYLFFPLYDGKTPLYIWILGIFSKLSLDPLLISRGISVGISLACSLVIARLVELITLKKNTFNQALFIWTILPFSFIFSRLALIDMLLTLWLSLSMYYYFQVLLRLKQGGYYQIVPGIFWGLALITKTSAFYFLPVYLALYLLTQMQKQANLEARELALGLFGFMLGSSMLLVMAFSPLFPFLFQRGADFTFSTQEIASNLPHILVTNLHRMGKWLIIYCSPLILLSLILLRSKKIEIKMLLIGLVIWLLPFLVTGKVLSSRYILPSLIFIVPLMTITLSKLSTKIRIITTVLFIGYCLYWNYFLIFKPNAAPFPIEDRVQFLTDWSSGHGIKESADFFLEIAKTQKILVATEGFFGTLPDGLMIYLDGKPELHNMRVEGVGLPIFGVPRLLAETSGFDRKFVVVNEHRFVGNPLPPGMILIQKYPRPFGGPSLLLLEFQEK